MAVDGGNNVRPEDLGLKVWVLIGDYCAHRTCYQKNNQRQYKVIDVLTEDARIGVPEEIQDRLGTRSLAGIDDIVSAGQQLVQIAGKVDRTAVFANGSQIGGCLAVEQTQFAQVGTRQCLQTLVGAEGKQLFQFLPVGLTFFQPAGG